MFQFIFKNTLKSVEVNDIKDLLGKIELIDVREPDEYNYGHLPTAKNFPMDELIAKADKLLDKSKEYHIICQSGGISSNVCNILKAKGFNVVNVSGGTGRYMGELER